MPDPVLESRCDRIDLDAADDFRDVVHRAVAVLAQGGTALIPTECGPTPAASALVPEAVAALGRPGSTRPGLIVSGVEVLADWVPRLDPRAERLISRAWPGPTGFAFDYADDLKTGLASRLPAEVRDRLTEADGRIAFFSFGRPFVRRLLELAPCPLLTTGELGAGGRSVAGEPRFRLVVESRPKGREDRATVAGVAGERWWILRPGAVSREELARMDGTMILFVCTGNTCRSPMAEALCKVLLAERLGCGISDLPERGWIVASAGVYAVDGAPAAAHAVEVVKGRGGSLVEHESRKATPELVGRADHLLVMTADHLDALLDAVPDAAPRARLLRPDGRDVDDPYGSDRGNYQRTADEIENCLNRLFDDLGISRSGG